MKHYETIHTEDTQGFHIVCSVGYEDTHPSDLYDDSCHDIEEICRKIDNGTYVWFIARVEAYRHGVLLASDYLGGCLYDNYKQFLEDAYYEDMVSNVVSQANTTLKKLFQSETEEV
jgi:hypothetical protein